MAENTGVQEKGGGGVVPPLPERMRPAALDLFLGQSHLEKRLRALLTAEHLPSLLFCGPPGCGKSTIALILAKGTGRPFRRISAPEGGLSQLRRLVSGVSVLVADELHRFSKAQQDFFLPLVENGSLTLLATTTENPSFAVTRQLLSRLTVLRMRPLGQDELLTLAKRGAEEMKADISGEVLKMLAELSRGDARALLNLVEYVAGLPCRDDPESVKEMLPDILRSQEANGGSHYDLTSALIKSIRGSDPDAALYYLACLLENGEDPRFICRRLILSASEDIGLADPAALTMAVSCQRAVDFVGMPEAYMPLAETTIYLALARKSNSSYAAYLNARREVRSQGPLSVPLHLRTAVTPLQKEWGYGRGYKYPHAYRGGYVEQDYLPDGLVNRRFYNPSANGDEPRLSQWWRRVKNIRDDE